MDLVAAGRDAGVAEPVHRVAGVHLGLAEVAPGRRRALLEQHAVRLPEPVARGLVEDVDEAGIAEIEIERLRYARDIERQRGLVDRVLPAFRRRQDKRLGDRDRAYAVFGKVADHVFRRRERVAVPVELAHVALDVRAEPVDVEDDGIERHVGALEAPHDVARLFLGAIAETRREIAERPARRQRLAAGDAGERLDQCRIGVAGRDNVRRAARDGLELQHVLLGARDVEPAARRVVERDDVALARQYRRQAVVHLPRLGRVAVVRLVVKRHALAAPVHAEHALAAAENFLFVVEPKAKPAQRLQRKVAVLLGDERCAVFQVGDADRLFVDDGGQPVDRYRNRVGGFVDDGGYRCRRTGFRKRRQLLDAGLAVVRLERGRVQRRQRQLANCRRDDDGLALDSVLDVVAEIGSSRKGDGEQQRQPRAGNGLDTQAIRHGHPREFTGLMADRARATAPSAVRGRGHGRG